jgi:hypothetical protein
MKLLTSVALIIASINCAAEPEFGFWVEMHDVTAKDCVCVEHRWANEHYVMTRLGAIEGGNGAYAVLPVYGLSDALNSADVKVVSGSYANCGNPQVWSEAKMWETYGKHFKAAYDAGDLDEDVWDDDDICWVDDVEDSRKPERRWMSSYSEYGAIVYYMADLKQQKVLYELVSGIWPDWEPVTGRQWIVVPTPKPAKSGITSFHVGIKVDGKYYTHTVSGVDSISVKGFCAVERVTIVGAMPVPFAGGSVSGCGVFAVDKKVTLKATANVAKPVTTYAPAQEATVFAGWFTDSACTQSFEAGVDYRTPSLPYVMPAEEVTLYAKFIPVSEDSGIALTADDGAGARDVTTNATETVFNFNTSDALNLGLEAESQSLPKLTVSGLPAGLKFTAKPVYVTGSKTEILHEANTVYGTATKPGTYVVTVKLTNTTVKKAIERKFTIVVDNFTGANSLLRDPFDNARGDRYEISAGVTEFDLPLLRSNNGAAVKVSGLPTGLKYNTLSGKIIGVATKAGTFTATVTVGIAVSTFTIQVDPLPSWLIGAYEVGCYEIYPDDTLNDVSAVKWVIGASGSVAGKVIFAWPDKVITESFKWNLTRKDEDGAFWIEGYEYDEAPGVFSIRIYPTVVDGVEFGRVEAAFEAWGSSGPSNSYTVYMQGAKDVWTKFREGSTARPLFSQGCSYYFAEEDANVFLELVFGNDGNVKVFNYAEASDTKAYSTASARLVPYEVQGDSLKAYCSFVIQGRDHAIGLVLKLSINTSYGTVYDSDIVVDEYHLQYAD